MSRFVVRAGVCAVFATAVAGCTMPAKPPQPQAAAATPPGQATPVQPVACVPVGQSALVGAWYSSVRQTGIKGEMQRLIVLQPDGSYRVETRQHDGRGIRAELRETGCWETTGTAFTTRVTHSNGEPVDAADPIYRNTYRIERASATQMVTRENVPGARSVTARKMPAGYRMP